MFGRSGRTKVGTHSGSILARYSQNNFIAELPLESKFPFDFDKGRISRDENPSVAEIHHNFVTGHEDTVAPVISACPIARIV